MKLGGTTIKKEPLNCSFFCGLGINPTSLFQVPGLGTADALCRTGRRVGGRGICGCEVSVGPVVFTGLYTVLSSGFVLLDTKGPFMNALCGAFEGFGQLWGFWL